MPNFVCVQFQAPTAFVQWPALTRLWLPKQLSSKESACSAGDAGNVSAIPGSGRPPGGGHGNALQYSCRENPWTEQPGGLQSARSPSWTRLRQLNTHTQ